jgi:abequosyltransferase
MEKLITIAIPTYNRAQLLDQQLAWLAKAINGFESECEIIIFDNCSTDNTQEIIQKWQPIFNNTKFKVHKNSVNIGLMANIALCLQSATSKYVWTVGDDDPIQETTLAYVVTKLKKNPSITLMFLNCLGRNQKTDKIVVKHWFNSDSDEPKPNGKDEFQRYLTESFGGVLFMTATIYKTELVQCALKKWPDSYKNFVAQAYWAGFCAAHGSILVTRDTYLECTMYASSWEGDPKITVMMQYIYIPELYDKLIELGYPQRFCRQMIVQNLRRKSHWKILLGALIKWPVLVINIIIPYLTLVSVSIWELIFLPKQSKSKFEHL